MIDLTTELVKEQDKWHRRYNDALIEIAKLTAENTNLECAIKKLIEERDCAIKDIKTAFVQVGAGSTICDICKECVCGEDFPLECGGKWRGVKR